MSNKYPQLLSKEDQLLREAYPPGASNQTQVTIEKICGFELFNTRPYHNYETWSDGYRATDGYFKVEAEDLDDCIRLLYELKTGKLEVKPWHLVNQSDREALIKQRRDERQQESTKLIDQQDREMLEELATTISYQLSQNGRKQLLYNAELEAATLGMLGSSPSENAAIEFLDLLDKTAQQSLQDLIWVTVVPFYINQAKGIGGSLETYKFSSIREWITTLVTKLTTYSKLYLYTVSYRNGELCVRCHFEQ